MTNRRLHIRLIHSQDTGYSALAAILAGKILRIPVILTSHGIRHKTLESILRSRLKNFLLRIEYGLDMFNIKNASKVIVVNPAIKQYLEMKSGRTVEFLPIGIKTSNFRYSAILRDQIRHELGIEDSACVVGYIGRFSCEKNLDTLVTSFAKALQNIPELMLILVGSGATEEKLKHLIVRLGIERNVLFCGVRYDINKILAGVDIFVLPSFTEGLSMSLLEAMACERAIICSDIDANRSVIIHNENGLLIDPSSPQELKQALDRLCREPDLRSNLGKRAKITALSYDEEIIFSKIYKTYESVV